MPRYGNPDSMHTALVPGWFLHLLSLVLLLFLLATCCHDNDSLHRALTTMVWYHCTYSVLAYLRMYLLDFMCSVKTPNGWVCWCLWTLDKHASTVMLQHIPTRTYAPHMCTLVHHFFSLHMFLPRAESRTHMLQDTDSICFHQ